MTAKQLEAKALRILTNARTRLALTPDGTPGKAEKWAEYQTAYMLWEDAAKAVQREKTASLRSKVS